jgi:hypothetical protein
MRKSLVLGIVAATTAVAGCGEARSQGGPSVDRNFQVGNFNRIEVAGPYEVDVRTGAQPSVRASGPERSVERMVVEVRGGTLQIHPQKRRGIGIGWSKDHPVRVAVTVPTLVAAQIAGSGDINVDRIAGESFEGGVAGSGDLRLGSIEVRQLKMGIAGSGEIRAEGGRAANAEYEIAGSGDIDAGGLVAETAAVSIAGSGNIAANATGTASVDIAGSGDVRIRGGARCRVSKAGSGNVDCS